MTLFTKLLTRWQANKKTSRTVSSIIVGAALFTSISFVSCSNKNSTLIIWTDRQELAAYTELFNTTHKDVKAIAIYKETLAASLPPSKKEIQPDLIIGSWLKGSITRKYFSPVDYLFKENPSFKNSFYPQMIEYGVLNEKQYLIPLSFNLPIMVFAQQNEQTINNEHVLSLDMIKKTAAEFNSNGRDESYSTIGYAPSWDKDFLYEATKIFGAKYQEKGLAFSWNNEAIESTVKYMRDWTLQYNQDTSTETDFQFKYLYIPKYKQLSSGRCEFAFMTSDQFFTLSNEQAMGLTFRWLVGENETVMVEDNIVTMGIFKKSKNKKAAEIFLKWISSESSQADLIKRTINMNLDTVSFGIAGGFSAIKNVNSNVFPSHYRELLGNLPGEQSMELPLILPHRWPILKEKVIETYLQTTTNTNLDLETEEYETMEDLVEDSKRFAY